MENMNLAGIRSIFMPESRKMKAGEFLEKVYSEIVDAHSYYRETFPLEHDVAALIFSSLEEHKDRHVFMKYNFADFVEIGNKIWALSLGKCWGGYVTESFDKDIIALQWDKEPEKPEEELITRISDGRVFRNSIVYATTNGRLGLTGKHRLSEFSENMFGEQMARLVREKMPELSINNPGHFDIANMVCYLYPSNIRYSGHAFGEPVYDQRLVKKMAKTIEELLLTV
ncbi:MAG: hypothetical protein ABIF10_00280 [Candidatus Woesearchaeota archaeon]